MKDWDQLKRLWPYMRADRRWLWLVIVMTPIGVGLGIVQTLLLRQAIDDHIAIGDVAGLGGVALAFVLCVTGAFGARAIGMYGLQILGLRGLTRLRRGLFTHVLAQGQHFYDKRTTGALMTRTTNDVEAIYESLALGAVTLLSDALTIAGTAVAMLLLDWKLTLVGFAVAPLIVLVVNVFRKRLRNYSVAIRQTLSQLNGYFAERINGMTVVQLYGAEDKARAQFGALTHAYADVYRKSNWWDAGIYAIMDGMSALAIGLMLWFGAVQFVNGAAGVTLGLLVAFIDYLGKIFVPIRDFSGNVATLSRSVAAMERVFALLDESDQVAPGTFKVGRAHGDIAFEGVSFAYGTDRPDVLHDVSFEVRPGEVVAIVGATGLGKSTLGKLLMRMYDGYRGSIRLDGHELGTLDLADLRRNVTVVHQDTYLFDGTLGENIGLRDPEIDAAKIRESARLARALPFIDALPDGLDHPVTERGGNLSGGQKQLLAIARALARDTPIVILDEATASVDSETEKLIDEAIADLLARKTVVVIAHRLSTIAKADRIVVLHHGRVVEQGTHEGLLAHNGRYKLLVDTGFAL